MSFAKEPTANLSQYKSKVLPVINKYCVDCHGPDKDKGGVRFDQFWIQNFSYFLKKLKDTKEGAANMLDNTLVLYGSTTSKLHYGRNYPLILAGGKGMGYKHGQYHKFDEEKYRMSDLMVTMQNSLGMKAETFGDSTKNLNDVFLG